MEELVRTSALYALSTGLTILAAAVVCFVVAGRATSTLLQRALLFPSGFILGLFAVPWLWFGLSTTGLFLLGALFGS